MAWVSLFGHDPETYAPHTVHSASSEVTYRETNCYADVLLELLHARGDEPLAVMGVNARMDFEGDQWTFFKPAPHDLETLFGIDIHEMQPYRPLPVQIAEQLRAGRTIVVELDSWFLPDTAATDYRNAHVKTSIAAEAIDLEGERLRYYHNTGLHELSGEDFRGVFRAGGAAPEVLPPYTELVRFDCGERLTGDALRAAARESLARHLALRPAGNPFERFAFGLSGALPGLLEGEPSDYHAYAFATVRMVGAGFELLAAHARWLLGDAAAEPVAALGRIVDGSKVLSLKLARRRAFDPAPLLADLASAWDESMRGLDAALD